VLLFTIACSNLFWIGSFLEKNEVSFVKQPMKSLLSLPHVVPVATDEDQNVQTHVEE